MPTYHALQTKVQLRIASLADSTTPVPERQKGKHATSLTERAENLLRTGRVLKETPIALGDDDLKLHHIGPEGTPFYLIHASEDIPTPPEEETLVERALRRGYELLKWEESRPSKPVVPSFGSLSTLSSLDPDVDFSEFEPAKNNLIQDSSPKVSAVPSVTPDQFALEIEKRRAAPIEGHGLPGNVPNSDISALPTNQHSLRHSSAAQGIDQSLLPQALGLSLAFSDQTFSRAFTEPYGLQDIKTDVYVNGDFTGSTTAPARKAADKNKAAEDTREPVFSGRRVHRMAERAMVLWPPEQNADGSLRPRNCSNVSTAGPEERWNEVNAALLEEANMMGFDKRGERPPVGTYLASVAALPMPSVVENFQRAGGPKFGVIDVVISVGSGWKLGPTSHYIMEPTRFLNNNFKAPKSETGTAVDDELPESEGNTSITNTNRTSADATKADLPVPYESTVAPEDGNGNLNLNPDYLKAEVAQANSSGLSKLPHEAGDPGELQDSKQTNSSLELAGPKTPRSSARPVTPPTDDPRQTLANNPRTRSDDILTPNLHFSMPQSSSVDSSSPERGEPSGQSKRVRRKIGSSEMRSLFGREFESLPLLHSAQGSMPPPRTPLSSLVGSRKRKQQSDAVMSSESQRPVKRNRNRGSSNSNADSPGKPFLARPGFVLDTNNTGENHKAAGAANPVGSESPASTSLIYRVIIKIQGEIVVERVLAKPLTLSQKAAVPETKVPSSPVFPLPESIVFSARKLSEIVAPSMAPLQPFQPSTPHASSSPARKPPKSRSSSPVKKMQTLTDQPASMSRSGQRSREQRIRTQDARIAEMDELWKMPELSKDCVVSFAEEGPWMTVGNGKGGVWRNVRSARPGSFKETDVLFGVRYVIG